MAPPVPAQRPRFGRAPTILLGVLVALAVVCVLFDWDWLRPALVHYLAKKSSREIRVEHLGMTGLFTLEPTVTLRGVYIENAPWADTKQPMAVAGEASFTFSIRSVFDDLTVISRIVLKDTDVDMEKQADGLRNWRLRAPEDRGPPKIKVLSLEAYRSKLRFVDRAPDRDFDIRFTSSEPVDATAKSRAGKPLVNRIDAVGVYRGARFSAQTLTGAALTFRDTGVFFPVRGSATAGGTRLDLDGEVADIIVRPQLDATVRIAGPTLEQLHPFVLLRPAASRPYRFEARVQRTQTEYKFTALHGRIGETDLAGDASHELMGERDQWRANLASAAANLRDLESLAGIHGPARPEAAPADRLFPRQPINAAALRAQDMSLRLDAKKLTAPGMPAVEGLRFKAELHAGVLEFSAFDLAVAGGHVLGQAALDVRGDVPHAQAGLRLAGLRLERLFTRLPSDAQSAGPLHGTLNLEGSGGSLAAILGAASGKVDVAIDGGSISNKLDAKLSLNLGKMAALLFKGDQRIPIYCAAAGFDFKSGIGRARILLVETEQTRIEGVGAVNLREEKQDFELVPRPKSPGLFTLGSSIHVGGTFKHPAVDFHKGRAGAPAIASTAHCPRPVTLAAAR